MNITLEDVEAYLSTVEELLVAEGMRDASEILRIANVLPQETGYDNWNGGTTIWTIYLRLEPGIYARLGTKHETIEKQINERLKTVLDQFTEDWYSAKIVPYVNPQARRHSLKPRGVSTNTRQNILDGLRIEGVLWSGTLDDVEFLARIFDLRTLPSTDSRFDDAAGDIWQHRVNNSDWPDDWVYEDQRLDLLHCNPELFLRFLSEILHPVVRQDRNETIKLVGHFNEQLQHDGWKFVEDEKIAGRPRFVAHRLPIASERSVTRARAVAEALGAGWMEKEIERLENAVDRDPALAIGTAKELVETCCKSILTKLNVDFSPKADLPELTKLLAKELKLVPEGISQEAKGADTIRLILRNLTALTQYIAELRGLYGSGHGRDGKYRGLEPRHARLAVGGAVTFIDFVTDTYHQRSSRHTEASDKS